MSEDQKPDDAASQAVPPPASERRGHRPGDLPKPVVAVVLTLAVLVFGAVGWVRFKSMREQAAREFAEQAARHLEQDRAELRRKAAEQEATEAAAASEGGESAEPATSTQTAPGRR